jgi:hypothetical protein
MNCWNIHPLPEIWLPLTSISSQNSNSSYLVCAFLRIKEATAVEKGYFADHAKNNYRDGIMGQQHRWNKCISLKRDYVE